MPAPIHAARMPVKKLSFIAPILLGSFFCAGAEPSFRPWNEYRTIMWVGDKAYKKPEKIPLFFQRLREMGVNSATAHNDGRIQQFIDQQFPFYVENMVNRGLCLKFSSKVTDWDKFVSAWAKAGRPEDSFLRDYCLDAPQWR